MNKILLLFGTFPPPLHGMSAVTQAVYDRLHSMRLSLVRVNTSPPTLKGGLYRLQRLPMMLTAWSQLVRFGRKQVLYIPLSGGWGQIYDIGTLLLARILGMQRILHHHSTAYLVRKRWITNTLFAVAGKDAVHIVLCDTMRSALLGKYKCPKIILLSNLAFFPMRQAQRTRKQLQTIGFLSNLTTEKGSWEVIELARAIQERRWLLQIVVAGPCLEPDLAQALRQAEQEGILQWRGAVYGEDKQRFWGGVDVLVFPTQYSNEAEPLVVWEALAAGVPVIAYDRGCIRGQVGLAGKIIPKEQDFIAGGLEILDEWMNTSTKYQNAVTMAQKHYRYMHGNAEIEWKNFVKLLKDRN